MQTFASVEAALEYIQSLDWGNSAGCCKDPNRVRLYAQAGAKTVLYGSIRPRSHSGNPGDHNFDWDPETGNAANSYNIPDPGIEVHMEVLPDCKKMANENGAQFGVSISGMDVFKPEDFYNMARTLVDANCVDFVEANLSCPNKPPSGRPNPIVCYDPQLYREALSALRQGARSVTTRAKISPITEAGLLWDLVDSCIQRDIDYIVAANTIGNCYLEGPDGKPLISMVLGGMSGPVLRAVVGGMMKLMVPQVKGTRTKVIATGGIEIGEHAYYYLRLGADAFGFNTVLSKRGLDPAVFKEMILGDEEKKLVGLAQILYERGLPH